jgi:hypothetical protein
MKRRMRRSSCLVICRGLPEPDRLTLSCCMGSSLIVFQAVNSGILKTFANVLLPTPQAAALAIRSRIRGGNSFPETLLGSISQRGLRDMVWLKNCRGGPKRVEVERRKTRHDRTNLCGTVTILSLPPLDSCWFAARKQLLTPDAA